MDVDDNFEHLDPLFLDLSVIAAVGQNEKIFTNTKEITILKNNFTTACWRFWEGEDGSANVDRIQELLTKVRREIVEFTSGRRHNAKVLERIQNYLVKARVGLVNMAYTYTDDINIKGRLDRLVEKLDDDVIKIGQYQVLCSNKKTK